MTRLEPKLMVLAVCAAAGCLAQASLGPGAGPPPPPPPPGGEVVVGGPIEAGCSYNATQLQRDIGATAQVRCPPGCASSGTIWGTDVYTSDSSICVAAVHAGASSPGGGMVTIQIEPGRPAYRGSPRNGVTSSDYGSYGGSYRFVGVVAAPEGPPPGPPSVIEAGCSFNATQLHGAPGSAHHIACPSGCGRTGATWGTDVYTADSAICRAAIHAGLLTEQGGEVTVVLEPGRPAYRGTHRHGIASSDYGQYGASYRFAR